MRKSTACASALLGMLSWLILGSVPAALADSAESADDATTIEIARRYFEHLDNQRLGAARALMADAIVFEDPTWGAASVTDPDQVIEAYSATAGFSNILLDERLAFASRGTAVFEYVVSLSFTPPDDSPVKGPVPVLANLVRFATVENGRIVRHVDLASYSALQAAVRRAETELSEQEQHR